MAMSGRFGPISEWIARRHNIRDRAAQFKMATMVVGSITSTITAKEHAGTSRRVTTLSAGARTRAPTRDVPIIRDKGVSSMTSETFDVVILGGGNAGIGVTGPVRRAGMSVAMIESHDLGGTCPNRGCTPKKVLVAAGHALHEIERAAVHHISVGKPKLDWAALIDREKDLIKDIPANLARSMAHRNVEVIKGHAVFAGPNAIRRRRPPP